MDEAFRSMTNLGFSPHRAIHTATAAPAILIGRGGLGRIQPTRAADICVLGDEPEVIRTQIFGSE
jgi:N-acetylglucosamine-6-phosphate deacetylase